ncbi:MAG: hypothetical protein KDG55_11740 [Rhodocyclaceae bacterium]|nr:hypothetical protein [Rhodocyclaceae bacterium]
MSIGEKLRNSYGGVSEIFCRYWTSYGGLGELLASPYVHVAAVLTVVLFPAWLHGKWWELSLQVVPSVLGFTLAGFTIWLGFGDDQFRSLIFKDRPKRKITPYIGVSAAFVHFIVVQFIAIVAALAGSATNFPLPDAAPLARWMQFIAPVGHGVGFFLFVYSLTSMLST